MSSIILNFEGSIATITLNRPEHLNALTREDYDAFSNALREIDNLPNILVTVWQATGHWFSAGTNVTMTSKGAEQESVRDAFRNRVVSSNLDLCQALASHSKLLVAALNGPVMGISAAFLGYFDFIFALPTVWLAVPFTFLGIIAEGGSSVSFVNRMKEKRGIAKANEVLIWGKKKEAAELLECRFLNQIFPQQSAESFHLAVREHLLSELKGLDPAALLTVKKLIRTGMYSREPDAVMLRESYAQAERFASGVPAQQFGRIARKEIRHKL